jgi:molybdenum cofactor sulfurtransferase
MPIRPPTCWCSLDAVPHVERSGSSNKHHSLNHRRETGSVDALSTSSDGSQSTTSLASYQTASDNTKVSSTSPVEVSKPQLRRSPSKHLLDFCRSLFHHDSNHAYALFLRAYPEYKLTRPIDTLRERDYKRLRRTDEAYVDYMGASLYPESLISSNSAFLRRNILGNTHSISARLASEL